MSDKYTATWVSHTSLSDFLQCPRAYFLKNVYRDPKTKHKIQLMSPPLALGSGVHEVLESLSILPTNERFDEPLIKKFDRAWKRVSGEQGGFWDADTEQHYRNRGEAMLKRVQDHPGPVARLAVKIKEDLPHYWISDEDNIILCGKVDWLEYLPDEDSVRILDFKTGKNEEDEASLQLPIYYLLVHNCQRRAVSGVSYWYLDMENEPTSRELPDLEEARERVLKIAREVQTARRLERFKCPHGEDGCFACRPMERILKGEGKFVGQNDYNQDVYILPRRQAEQEEESVIL